jgi:hypothetical protein
MWSPHLSPTQALFRSRFPFQANTNQIRRDDNRSSLPFDFALTSTSRIHDLTALRSTLEKCSEMGAT